MSIFNTLHEFDLDKDMALVHSEINHQYLHEITIFVAIVKDEPKKEE